MSEFESTLGYGPQVRFTGVGAGFIDVGQNAAGDFVVEGRITSYNVCYTKLLRVLESGNLSFRNPTTGALAGKAFFFMSNPRLQDWDGTRVVPAPDGARHEVLWIQLGN